jgi:hypothetical protein
MSLKIKRGTNDQRLTIVPAEGELVYATDIKKLFVGDGDTTGGNIVGLALGGTLENDLYLDIHHLYGSNGLDLNGNNGNISANNIFADFHGSVYGDDSTILVDAMNSVILGPISVDINSISITGGASGEVLITDGTGNLSWATLSSGGLSLPSQTGHAGEFLTTDGSGTISWGTPSGSGISLPSQSGHSGQFLTTDGSGNLSWQDVHHSNSFYGDIYSTDSTLLLSGSLNYLSNGIINFDGQNVTTTSTTGSIDFYSSRLDLYNTSTSPIIIKSNPNTSIKFETFNGSFNSVSAVEPGDVLSNFVYTACDGFTQLTYFPPAARISVLVDPNGTVSQGIIPTKVITSVVSTAGSQHHLAFDSAGHLGVNNISPTETLDVVGTGKFTGFVQFGSYSTTDRNSLTPAYGMVIYNTTDNKFQGYQNTNGNTPEWVNLS